MIEWAREMKAAFVMEPGPADSVRYGDLPVPRPGPGQVLVRTEAVAVNPIDTYVRSGMVPMDLPSPYIPGCDIAGVVESVGEEVSSLRPGDRVWGSNQGILGRQGTFAEFAAIDEEWLYPIPGDVESTSAAATALVGITAHLGLFAKGRAREGETIFVSGGSGGVGSCVIQMARIAGCRVLTSAGSEDKAAACRELGAEAAFLYPDQHSEEFFRAHAPDGVDLWWETVREPDFDRAVSHLAECGRIILMAGREARPAFPVGPFYVKQCSLQGFVMFKASADLQRRCAVEINRWMADGRLGARIDRVLPLSEAAAAHALQEESTIHGRSRLAGKIVLVPG